MNILMRDALIDLKKQVLDNYNPIKISEKTMTFLLNYSNEIPYKFHSDLHQLIAMDMGDEFILPKEECIRIINELLAS